MNSGQACRPCRGSCIPIPGRDCFGDLHRDEIVVSPPSPIVEPLEDVYTRRTAGCGDMSEVVLLQRAVYEIRQAGRQRSLRLSRVHLQKIDKEQSKADPCVFHKVVDRDVIYPHVYVHVDNLAATAKDRDTFDGFYAQLKEEVPVNGMDDLPCYPRCTFQCDKMEGVMKMTQTAFVDSPKPF